MDRLGQIAREHSLIIIEDAAQALGSMFEGKCAGTFGLAGAISFYSAKVLGCLRCLGDGGAVITNDDKAYERLLQGAFCNCGTTGATRTAPTLTQPTLCPTS